MYSYMYIINVCVICINLHCTRVCNMYSYPLNAYVYVFLYIIHVCVICIPIHYTRVCNMYSYTFYTCV